MLIVIVDFLVAPGNRQAALEVLLTQAPMVRTIKGNLSFQPYLDPVAAQAVRVFHEWQDAESFEVYTLSSAFEHASQALRPLMLAPPASRRMKASLLETVHQA